MRLEQHPLRNNFPFPELATARPSRMVLPPGLPHGGQVLAERNFTKDEIIEILQAALPGQGRRLYFFGQIDYVDAFRKPRWTRFCMSFQGRHDWVALAQQDDWAAIAQILSQTHGAGLTFEFANQHNETDDS